MSAFDLSDFGPCDCPLHNRLTGEIMPHWRSLVESKYLSHFELKGREVAVTIKSVQLAKVVGKGGKKANKALFMFEGKEKGAVMGVACMSSIAGMYGEDYSNWIGKRITLYPTTTEATGDDGKRQTVGTIRVRPVPPGASSAPPSPKLEQPPDEDEDARNRRLAAPAPDEVPQ